MLPLNHCPMLFRRVPVSTLRSFPIELDLLMLAELNDDAASLDFGTVALSTSRRIAKHSRMALRCLDACAAIPQPVQSICPQLMRGLKNLLSTLS